MKREVITIENDHVSIPQTDNIWMSLHEISHLFDCLTGKVNSNVRAILKTGVLNEADVCRTFYYENGNSVEWYNLEMIIALSFRIKSHHSDLFRRQLMKKAVANISESPILMIGSWNNCCFSSN